MSLESLDKTHERGGDCDKQRDKLWQALRRVEENIVDERIELVRISTKIAIYTGLICGIPGLIVLILEIIKK